MDLLTTLTVLRSVEADNSTFCTRIYFGSPFGQNMILPALWQGLWQAFAAMGIMVGAFGNGMMQDMFGRKIMFAVGGSVSAIGKLGGSELPALIIQT